MFKFNLDGNLEFIDRSTCCSFLGTAIIGSGVLAAGATIYGANKAASAQTSAADAAIANSKDQFNTTRSDLAPYRDTGANASTMLNSKLSDLTTPISVNPQDFINSDMYKFLQAQGERGVTNSSAARGLGTSGAALKGSAAFESGLNLSQYQQNFNNQNTNQTNAYTRLKGLVDTGENAAAQTGVLGNAAVTTQNSAITGAGNAQAAADNAIGTGVTNAANTVSGAALYKGIYGNSSSGPSAGPITYGGPNGPVPFAQEFLNG